MFINRNKTERTESLNTGACRLVGVNPFKITKDIEDFINGALTFKMKDCKLYGKDSPSEEIVKLILEKEKTNDQ